MPKYDSVNFDPPAPLAAVTLRNPAAGTSWENIPMLLDSGADVSLVPAECLRRLSASIDSSKVYELAGFDGARSVAQAVHLDLIFVGQTFRGRFLLIHEEIGIIGRDILNHFTMMLDGPNLTWDRR
jgi:hypothetical protein